MILYDDGCIALYDIGSTDAKLLSMYVHCVEIVTCSTYIMKFRCNAVSYVTLNVKCNATPLVTPAEAWGLVRGVLSSDPNTSGGRRHHDSLSGLGASFQYCPCQSDCKDILKTVIVPSMMLPVRPGLYLVCVDNYPCFLDTKIMHIMPCM